MKVVRLQIVPSMSCTIQIQPLGGCCPTTTWTQSLVGLLILLSVLPPHELNHWEDFWYEYLSYHHMNSITGRTVDPSFCPTTTRTQPAGGHSTYHQKNSIPGRSICQPLEQSCHQTTPHYPSIENVFNHDRKCRPIPTNPIPCPLHTVPWSLLHLQNRAHKTKRNELDLWRLICTNYASPFLPFSTRIHSIMLWWLHSYDLPNTDCWSLLTPAGDTDANCSFWDLTRRTSESIAAKSSLNLSHSSRVKATPVLFGYQWSSSLAL